VGNQAVKLRAALPVVAAVVLAASCAGVKRPQAPAGPPPAGASMWVEPADLASRDLFYGPWGKESAPDPAGTFKLVERKHTGTNLGMTVIDEQHREWSVKQSYPGGLDPEGPVEVVLSRLLSAVGYHQPPVYFLPAFRMKDDWGTHTEVGGRFRLKHESFKSGEPWRWESNPFVGSKPYQGLIVLLMMFNSTDLKNSNNSTYIFSGDPPETRYAVRDIGAALGDFDPISPRKNNIDAFEKYPFIVGVNGGFVQFAYHSWYKNLVQDRITPDDVVWACDLLGRLTKQQWDDAFRAGGYEPAVASRFIAKLQEKIDQGRALATRRQ
jgi:hypothetical protein